jgi:hypothetical protein
MFQACLLLFVLQESPAAPPEAAKPERGVEAPVTAKPNGPRAPKGVRKYLKGTLGSLNTEQRTVRFTDQDGKERVWPVDPRMAETAGARAADIAKILQPGDPITVVYHEDDGKPTIVNVQKRGAGPDQGEHPAN